MWRVDASKPIFEADELTFTDESVAAFRSALRDRMVLLVASLEQRSEDRIREFADDLDAAIAELRVAEQFPEVIEDDLDAPKSSLYTPREIVRAPNPHENTAKPLVLVPPSTEQNRLFEHRKGYQRSHGKIVYGETVL